MHAPPAKEIKLEDHCEYRYVKKIITVIYSVAVWRKLNILQLGRHVLDTSIFIVSIISPNQ